MTSTQSTELQAVLFLAIIIWRLVSKMQERPVKTDAQRWRLPLILTVIGGYETVSLTKGAHPITFSSADLTYLVAVSAVSIVLGLIRGATIRIQDRGGMLTQQYTGLTVGLWLGTVAVRLGLDVGASHAFGVASAVTGTSILMMFGLSLLGESAAVALRTGGIDGVIDGGTGRGGFDGGGPADRIPADQAGGRRMRAESARFDRLDRRRSRRR